MTAPISSTSASSANAIGNMVAGMLAAPVQVAAALAGALTKGVSATAPFAVGCAPSLGLSSGFLSSCCEIPPPCWEPQPVGSCALQVAPGGSATIRVHISNCGWTRQIVNLTALGRIAGLMTFTRTAVIVGPQETVNVLVTIQVPAGARIGASLAGPLIIRGCRDHFARVQVTVADCLTGNCNCCDLNVNDCADQLHHWYDHFYCPRPCNNVREPAPINPQRGTSVNG